MKEKQNCARERPKLENVRMLRCFSFIDPEEKEFSDIIKKAHKNWKYQPPLLCLVKRPTAGMGQLVARRMITNQHVHVYLEADESKRL